MFCCNTQQSDIMDAQQSDIKETLNHIKWEDTQEFTFPIEGGYVIKVYDGDTITIASKLPYAESPLYRFQVRLNGIDTPELKGKNVSTEEKEMAKKARTFVERLILNKYVVLKNVKNEKYGRILADVYIGDDCVNELLLINGLAVKYDGKTKTSNFITININCENSQESKEETESKPRNDLNYRVLHIGGPRNDDGCILSAIDNVFHGYCG